MAGGTIVQSPLPPSLPPRLCPHDPLEVHLPPGVLSTLLSAHTDCTVQAAAGRGGPRDSDHDCAPRGGGMKEPGLLLARVLLLLLVTGVCPKPQP